MSNVDHAASSIEDLSKQIGFLKTLVGALASVVVIGFGAGIVWARLIDYEHKIDEQKEILGTTRQEIKDFRRNLGDLGTLTYDVSIVGDSGSGICQVGAVIVGIVRQGSQLVARCASVGRAAWNPNPNPQGISK